MRTCSTLAERQLQEARALRAEGVGVAAAEEAVAALAGRRRGEPARAERVLDLARERRARGDDLDAAAEHPLQHRAHERVVRAAEDDRVDARLAQRRDVAAHDLEHVARRTASPAWMIGARSGHGTATRSTCGSAAGSPRA